MAQCPRVDFNGYLELDVEKWDVRLWIETNTHSLLSVRTLKLCAGSWNRVRVVHIPDSIGELTELTHLLIRSRGVERLCLPDTVERLHKLVHLDFSLCGFDEMPANLGQLASLQQLSLSFCHNIKSLPNSIATLSKLTTLKVDDCDSLIELPVNLGQLKSLTDLTLRYCHRITELPANLGQLMTLTYFYIDECDGIKSLPNSMENLYKLETLSITRCESLTELPVNLNVFHLLLDHCYIRFLPNINLQKLSILDRINNNLLSIRPGLRSLQQLYLEDDIPLIDWHELPGLLLLDISDSRIIWLPWTITKLRELQFLFLSSYFRLETLPPHLKDSLIVSVRDKHVRRTWKQLKAEISFPVAGELEMEAAHNSSAICPPGYLLCGQELDSWICENKDSRNLVRILDLENVKFIGHSIWKLKELTHLYMYCCKTFPYIPDRVTGPTYLSLEYCNIKSLSESLSKLSKLETLDVVGKKLPANINMLVNLKRLSLRSCNIKSLARIKLLPNLNTLELYHCRDLNSLPIKSNLTKLKLSDCTLKSFPTGLLHLEILHSRFFCYFKDDIAHDDSLDECLKQLVNLKTLSFTCHKVKFLPRIAKLHNLEELELKDCFSLKELPENLDELVKLRTLDISGTRIKSLPDSITKLHNLQQLILPRCFIQGSFPRNLDQKVSITRDTDELYYKHVGYYDPCYETSAENCNEGNDIARHSMPEVVEAVPKETELNVTSAYGQLNSPLPDIPGNTRVYNFMPMLESDIAPNAAAYGQLNSPLPDTPDNTRVYNFMPMLESDIAPNAAVDEPLSTEPEQNVIFKEIPAHTQLDPPLRNAPDTEIVDSCEQTLEEGVAAQNHAVSRSTMKRRPRALNTEWSSSNKRKQQLSLNTEWSSSKKGKQHLDGKNTKNNGESPSENNSSQYNLVNSFNQLALEHEDGASECALSYSVQGNESSSTFTVKATYKDDTVKFDFSLSSTMEQLKEVGKQVEGLDLSKIKIKYEDEDGDWILLNEISKLREPLRHSRSSKSVVKLLVVDKT